MKLTATIFFCLLFSSFVFAQTDICGIDLGPGTRVAAFAKGEQITIKFEYSTDEAAGVRIFVRPVTNGELTRGYTASGSPVYTGSGNGQSNFTINTDDVTVDEIRFRMTTADQSTVLREFYVPVHYEFGENGVHDFVFSHNQEVASFLHGEQVNIKFDYNVNHSGGARIFVRPMSNGGLTPGYGASGSVLFNGTGSQTVNFSINSGKNVRVDSLRVQVLNGDQTRLLQEFFIPVNWYWSTAKVANFIVEGSPLATNGENRTVKFDYETTEAAGVVIFPRPFTDGGLTPDYGACGSVTFTGTGERSCGFTISANNQRVDHVRINILNPAQTETILQVFYPTDLYFGSLQLRNIVACPPSSARLANEERVNVSYTLNNQSGADTRVFYRPLTEGNLTPGYSASGSPLYAVGARAADDFFTFSSGDKHVDQVRFKVTNGDQSTDLASFLFDVDYTFGEPMTTSAASPLALDRVEWKVFPNPLTDHGQLSVTARESHTVNIRLVDLLGRNLASWPAQRLTGGQEFRLPLDRAALNLRPGTYFLHLQGGDYSVTETVVVR